MGRVREAMIVAGGQGTRLRPLTSTTPKPLLPFCGLPFLNGVIRNLAAVGVEHVLLVVGADTTPFAALHEDAGDVGVTVEVVPEPTPLDTAGGVRAALDRVTGTFLVLNGDILTGLDLQGLIEQHSASGAMASLALTRVEDTSAYGVCVLDGRRIVDFVEKPPLGTLPGQDAVNAGSYVLEPDAMSRFPLGRLSFERQVFPRLVEDGEHVHGVVSDAVWADLGTPERFLHGHRLVLDGQVDWPSPTASLHDTQQARQRGDIQVARSAIVRGPVQLGPGTRIDEDGVVGPYVVTGRNVRVAGGAQVRDSVLFDHVVVGPSSIVGGALLGRRVTLGSGVRLGTRTVIGDDLTIADDRIVPSGARIPVDHDTSA